MAIVLVDRSIGYHASVGTVEWGQLTRFLGSDYALGAYAGVETDDLMVTAVAGADRTVQIKRGTTYGHGIMDTLTTDKTLALPPLASGVLWYTIAVRRDWRNEQTFLVYEPGALNAPAAVSTALNKIPGSVDDQQIALVKIVAGQTQPAEIIQLRQYTSKRATLSNLMAWTDAPIGAEADVEGVVYRMTAMPDGTKQWRYTTPRFWRGKVWDGSGGIAFDANQLICPPIFDATDAFARTINMRPGPTHSTYGKRFTMPAPGGYRFTWQAHWDYATGGIAAVRIYINKPDTNIWWPVPDQAADAASNTGWIAEGVESLRAPTDGWWWTGVKVSCEVTVQMDAGDTVMFTTFHTNPDGQVKLRFGEMSTYCTVTRIN